MKQIIARRYWWFALSALLILPGLYGLLLHPLVTTGQFSLGLRPSIDFTGGALWELYLPGQQLEQLDPEQIAEVFAANGFEGAQVQLSRADTTAGEVSAAVEAEQQQVLDALTARYGTVELARLDNVGAILSQESTRNAIIAVLGASLAIMVYLTWAFRQAPHPLRYGVCSIVAMFHDVILMIGIAALLGIFFAVEVDVLFVTALLTILAFSVHDKIVIFDRIRENLLKRRELRRAGESQHCPDAAALDQHPADPALYAHGPAALRRRIDQQLRDRAADRPGQRHLLLDLHRPTAPGHLGAPGVAALVRAWPRQRRGGHGRGLSAG
jgi:preprotein translocase subunit SecF